MLKETLEADLAKISKWLNYHYLTPNVKKTHYLLFHNKRRHEDFYEHTLNIKFNTQIIERIECTKLLGILIDETLSFTQHIHEMQNKIVSFLFALKRIRPLISEHTAKTLYFAYIQSRLNYMSSIYIAAPAYSLNALEIIQRKALRTVFRKNWNCSGSELYSTQILPVTFLCQFTSSILAFKMNRNLAKLNIEVIYQNNVHRYPTRNNDNIVISRTQTHLGAQNFFIRSFSFLNNLPNNIKYQTSISKFKSKLRDHLYEIFMMRYDD
jgi:hypothetical protein